MKIAVFSDIHGNCIGLDAMLADLKQHPADRLVCLGDAIQGGPQPAQVVARLKELACPVVMGNADYWLATGEDSGREVVTPERQRKLDAVRAWSLGQLAEEDLAFIAAFQPTVTIEAGKRRLLCFHGSPTSFDDLILPTTPEEEFQKYLGAHADAVLCGGHTHIQHIRRIGDSIYFNPGSVGFAYSHAQEEDGPFRADPWAEYAVLTLEGRGYGLEFRRVPYDAGRLVQVYRDSGHPYAEQDAERYEGR